MRNFNNNNKTHTTLKALKITLSRLCESEEQIYCEKEEIWLDFHRHSELGGSKKTHREKQNLRKSSSGKQVKRHRVERQVNKEGRRLGQTDKREIRRGKEKKTREVRPTKDKER